MRSFIHDLDAEQRVIVYDLFLQEIEEKNRTSGTIYGTVQIVDRLENIAIRKGFIKCPCCGRSE